MRYLRALLPLFAGLSICLAIAACGGGSDSPTAEPEQVAGGANRGTSPPPQSDPAPNRDANLSADPPAQPGKEESENQSDGGKPQPVTPLVVVGGGSAQFHVEGGDNSIQEFGSEGSEAELEEAALAVHGLLAARVSGEWQRACALLSTSAVEDLEELVARTSELRAGGCPAALAAITTEVSPSFAREFTTVEAAGLRHDGEQAFLIYTGRPGKTVYAIALQSEDGVWKPAAIAGSPLSGA